MNEFEDPITAAAWASVEAAGAVSKLKARTIAQRAGCSVATLNRWRRDPGSVGETATRRLVAAIQEVMN